VLMKEVETATGRTLRVDDELRNEVLYINVKGVEEQALLDLIADAADARWRSTSSSMVLEPDVAKRRRQAEAELSALREGFLADLELVAKSETDDPVDAELYRVLRRIPVSVLKRSFPNRVVFSTAPNPSQDQLLGWPDRLVTEIVNGDRKLRDHVQSVVRANPLMADGMKEFLGTMGLSELMRTYANEPGMPAEVLISFNFLPLQSGRSESKVNVVILDKDGLAVATLELDLTGQAKDIRDITQDKPAEVLSDKAGPAYSAPLEFRVDSKELLEYDFSVDVPNWTFRDYPKLMQWMDQPDVFELLSFTVSDAWDSWAKFYRRNLVVSAEDGNTLMHDHNDNWPRSVGDFDNLVKRRNDFYNVNGVEVVKPKRPNMARLDRMDRDVMRQFLAIGRQNGDLPEANARAALVDSRLPHSRSSTTEVWYTTFAGLPNVTVNRTRGSLGWFLWNRIDSFQKQQLISGASIPMTLLGDRAIEIIRYEAWSNPNQVQRVSKSDGGLDARIRYHLGTQENAFPEPRTRHFEPTEMWPNGFVANGVIRPRLEEDMLIVPTNPKGDVIEAYGFTDVESFAWNLAAVPLGEQSSEVIEWSHFKVGTIQRVFLYIQLTPEFELVARIEIPKLNSDAPVYAKSNLPTHVRAEVDRVHRRMAESGLLDHFRRRNQGNEVEGEADPLVLN